MSWLHLPWSVIDTETTGVDPATARIWEIAILFVGGERDHQRTRTYVNPGEEIPREVQDLCHLGAKDLAAIRSAPPFRDVLGRLQGHLLGLIVGYNVLDYDWPLLRAEAERAGGHLDPAEDLPIIDPLVFARRLLFRLRSRRLDDVARHLGVTVDGRAHRALADCHMAEGVLRALAPMLPTDFIELREVQAAWKAGQDADRQLYGYWLARDPEGGTLTMACGKHCGIALGQVDPGYLRWAVEAHTKGKMTLPEHVVAEFERALGL